MVNNAVVSHNSVNELYYLEEVDSTNTWAKANLDKFGPVGAVYTTSQTAGRGRRGHTWINASGQALYYTVVLKTELAQPESLPLFASMAVADALEQRYGIQCQIKWPNDLLLRERNMMLIPLWILLPCVLFLHITLPSPGSTIVLPFPLWYIYHPARPA